MKAQRSMKIVTIGVSRWSKRAKPPTSGVSPILGQRIALTCEVGGPFGPV